MVPKVARVPTVEPDERRFYAARESSKLAGRVDRTLCALDLKRDAEFRGHLFESVPDLDMHRHAAGSMRERLLVFNFTGNVDPVLARRLGRIFKALQFEIHIAP